MTKAITPRQAVQHRFSNYLLQLGLGTGAAMLVAYYIAGWIARGRDKVATQVAGERETFFRQVNAVLEKTGIVLKTDAERCRLRFELGEAARFISRPLEGLKNTSLGSIGLSEYEYFPYITRDYPDCDAVLAERFGASMERDEALSNSVEPQKQQQSALAKQRQDDFKILQEKLPCTHRVADTYCEVDQPTFADGDPTGDLYAAVYRGEQIRSWNSKNKLYGRQNGKYRRLCDPRQNPATGKSDCGPHSWAVETRETTLIDNPYFTDENGHTCEFWKSQKDCAATEVTIKEGYVNTTEKQYTYTPDEVELRKQNCKLACNKAK